MGMEVRDEVLQPPDQVAAKLYQNWGSTLTYHDLSLNCIILGQYK